MIETWTSHLFVVKAVGGKVSECCSTPFGTLDLAVDRLVVISGYELKWYVEDHHRRRRRRHHHRHL